RPHLEDDVGAPGVIADLGPSVRVSLIRVRGALTGAGLDVDLDLLRRERLDHVRDQRHAALTLGGLLWDSDLHVNGGRFAINGGHNTAAGSRTRQSSRFPDPTTLVARPLSARRRARQTAAAGRSCSR